MKHLWNCRRSGIAVIGLTVLAIGLFNGIDTSSAIAMICVGIAGSNAYEKKAK
tara:strand:+ start:476 stop:634 length:159 start_codon:yes stop_codon:yes gene_type:complete